MKFENLYWLFFVYNEFILKIKNKEVFFWLVALSNTCIIISKCYTSNLPAEISRAQHKKNVLFFVYALISLVTENISLYNAYCATSDTTEHFYILLSGLVFFMTCVLITHTYLISYKIVTAYEYNHSIEYLIESERRFLYRPGLDAYVAQTFAFTFSDAEKIFNKKNKINEKSIIFFDNEDLAKDCPICCEVIKKGAELPCKHAFCRGCLESWYAAQYKRNCPYCRQ